MRRLQPNDRVVVHTGYACGVVGGVRAVDAGIGQTLYRVDYDAFIFHEHHVSHLVSNWFPPVGSMRGRCDEAELACGIALYGRS